MIIQQYKIVFGGTMGAGKSRAIKALSEIDVLSTEALNTDLESHEKMLTTVGIDYGEITLDDGVKVGLYGTPGQERFEFIWAVICKGAIGTIVMIDHATENPLLDLAQYAEAFKPFGNNIVIARLLILIKNQKERFRCTEIGLQHKALIILCFSSMHGNRMMFCYW